MFRQSERCSWWNLEEFSSPWFSMDGRFPESASPTPLILILCSQVIFDHSLGFLTILIPGWKWPEQHSQASYIGVTVVASIYQISLLGFGEHGLTLQSWKTFDRTDKIKCLNLISLVRWWGNHDRMKPCLRSRLLTFFTNSLFREILTESPPVFVFKWFLRMNLNRKCFIDFLKKKTTLLL